jgi:hypothetical protein
MEFFPCSTVFFGLGGGYITPYKHPPKNRGYIPSIKPHKTPYAKKVFLSVIQGLERGYIPYI